MKKATTDLHHLVWTRRAWNKGIAKELRQHWYMRVEIPKDTLHRQIHHEIPNGIPVPNGKEIKHVLDALRTYEKYGVISHNDNIDKRMSILLPLFQGRAKNAMYKQFRIVSKFMYPPKRKNRPHRK